MDPASILIVEDEAVVALDLQTELESRGYRIAGVADTAERALAVARQRRPQLALMDIHLRGEVDGIAAAQALRDELGTPVVFLTSFSDASTVGRAARTGAYGYLTKPFQARELVAGIEVALWKAQMEQRLQESERWFASTLRCVQDGVVLVDVDARIRFMNAAAEALLGCSAEEATGQPVGQVVQFADDAAHARTAVERALGEGHVVGVSYARPLRRRDGSTRPVDESAGPIHDDRGRPMGAVLVLRDAGERVRQEAQLRASEERFRGAFAAAPLGMALVALDGVFLQVNAALCRLLGCDAAWLLGRSQAKVTHPQDQAHERARLDELLVLPPPRDPVAQFEKRYLRADGGPPVSVLVSATVMVEAGAAIGHLYQVHDLTAQRAAAARLAELAEERVMRQAGEWAERSRNDFLVRVSHEMRTPLNAVLGFAELLKLQQAAGLPANGAYPEHILRAGRHLLALVDDVLDLQRASNGQLRLQMGSVSLDDVVPGAIELLAPMAQARGVRLEQALAPGLRLHADATRLRQIVLNLGSNAIKYNVQGGTVVFRARIHGAGRVMLQVEDGGIGMSAEQLEHLFEPFNRLGREALPIQGVGLGLVVTRQLVEQMGGTMSVASTPGRGTVVGIELAQGLP